MVRGSFGSILWTPRIVNRGIEELEFSSIEWWIPEEKMSTFLYFLLWNCCQNVWEKFDDFCQRKPGKGRDHFPAKHVNTLLKCLKILFLFLLPLKSIYFSVKEKKNPKFVKYLSLTSQSRNRATLLLRWRPIPEWSNGAFKTRKQCLIARIPGLASRTYAFIKIA